MGHRFYHSTPQRRGSFGACNATSTPSIRDQRIAAAPALELDDREAAAVRLSNDELIAEAIAINYRNVKPKTLGKYREHLDHLDGYLTSLHGVSLLDAKHKQIHLFMKHLERPGGGHPDDLRLGCAWCASRGYPDTVKSGGWSASTRKSYLSAVRFLYAHCMADEDLPDVDPTALMKSAKVTTTIGYTPSPDDVKKLLEVEGRARDTLLAFWMYFAPSRRETYRQARWQDIDLDEGVWYIPTAKNDEFDSFRLNPRLRAQLRRYREWQLKLAKRNEYVRFALSDPETAYVLLSNQGRQCASQTLSKMITWRAVRAGIGLVKAKPRKDGAPRQDCPGGYTSKVTPHALRRAWATHALNDPDPKKRVPIEVVSKVLGHKDISTTRKHYAPTKGELVDDALLRRCLA